MPGHYSNLKKKAPPFGKGAKSAPAAVKKAAAKRLVARAAQ